MPAIDAHRIAGRLAAGEPIGVFIDDLKYWSEHAGTQWARDEYKRLFGQFRWANKLVPFRGSDAYGEFVDWMNDMQRRKLLSNPLRISDYFIEILPTMFEWSAQGKGRDIQHLDRVIGDTLGD